MSGLFWRSHTNAGQDGFRGASSKHKRDLLRPVGLSDSLASGIDRSLHLLTSCKFWHRLSAVAVELLPATG